MGIHLSKEREKFETFETYMFVKSLNQNFKNENEINTQLIHQVMVKNIYL